MTKYTSPFGNGVLVGSGGNVTSNVHNQFGPRGTSGTVGVLEVDGMTQQQLVIDFNGKDFADDAMTLVPFIIPKGAIVKAVYADTTVAGTMTGTSPTILVGTKGSEVTNGFVITSTQQATVGPYNLTSTLAGTWDAEAPLAADTTVGFALGGTTPTLNTVGKIRITVVYDRVNL